MDLYTIRNELMAGKSIYDLNLRVTYYTRVSTLSSEQLHSLQSQVSYFEDFIKQQKNWTYVKGYIDEGITGTSINKRDSFNKMINDARNKKFDLIITKEVSRFARNTVDSLFYTRELLKYGIGVFFQNDNINTLMPDSELRLTIMSSMAQEESRKISDRVRWGHQQSIKNGRVLGNDNIWGYNKDNGKLVINEEEAKIVQRIFELYCDGYGFRKISEILLKEGIKNRNGRPFNFSSLKHILTNPKYKGYYVGNKSTTVDYITKEREHHEPDKWIVYKDYENVPPIVSEEIWDRANYILKERSVKMSSEDKTSYQNKFLYSGKIICNEHNTTYWRNIYKYDTIEDKEVWQCKIYRQKGKQACTSPILYKHELDLIMQNILFEFFNNKQKYLQKTLEIAEKILDDNDYDKDIKAIMKEIELIEKRKDSLIDLRADGDISPKEFKKKYDNYNIEISKLEEQMKKYEELNAVKFQKAKYYEKIKEYFTDKMEFKDKQFNEKMAENFLDKIIVYNDGIENLINLDIILKTGIKIPVHYIVNRNQRLYPSIHIDNNKRIFKFTRKHKNKPIEIVCNINVKLNLLAS